MKSAKSSSSSTLRKQSTDAEESPHPRSRSKPHEPEGFLLWIPEYLQDLENQVQSRKRTLELLKSDPRSPSVDFQEQIEARDLLISSLNKSILDLKTELKSRDSLRKDKSIGKQFSMLEKEVEELKTGKTELENQLHELQLKSSELQDSWENEKNDLGIMQEALYEEIEEYKTIVQLKENHIEETSEDISKLQEIIQSLTNLNSSLQQKLETKNKEMEETLLKSQDFLVKASQADDLEKRLNFYFSEKIELEKKISQLLLLADNVSRLNSLIDWAGKNLDLLEENSKKQLEALSKSNFHNSEKVFMDLQFFFQELANSLATVKHNLIANKAKVIEGLTGEANLRNLLKEKELELEKNIDYVNSFKTKEAALLEKIKEIELLMEKNRIEYKNEINKLAKLPEVFNAQLSKQNVKISELSAHIESLSSQLSSAKLKISHLTGRFEQSQKRKKELQENQLGLTKTTAELREKLKIILEGQKDSVKLKGSQEMKLKKLFFHAQILRDEVFRKDTELVKAGREKMRFDLELASQSAAYQKLVQKFKNVQEEVLKKVQEDLQEKDRQIEILKEMLRSAHSEIKIKDMKISGFSKLTQDSDRFRSPNRRTTM